MKHPLALLLVGGPVAVFTLAAIGVRNTPPQPPSCGSDWHLCKDNSDLANHYSKIDDMQVDCKIAADRLAKWGDPKWPRLYFGTFETGDAYLKSGVVTLIENDVQFQNGFGAYGRTSVRCDVDLTTGKVVNVSTSE